MFLWFFFVKDYWSILEKLLLKHAFFEWEINMSKRSKNIDFLKKLYGTFISNDISSFFEFINFYKREGVPPRWQLTSALCNFSTFTHVLLLKFHVNRFSPWAPPYEGKGAPICCLLLVLSVNFSCFFPDIPIIFRYLTLIIKAQNTKSNT